MKQFGPTCKKRLNLHRFPCFIRLNKAVDQMYIFSECKKYNKNYQNN